MALCSTPLPPYPFVPKEKRADGKWGKEMREENVIFHCLVGVKRDRQENRMGRVHLSPQFIFCPNCRKNY